jgi:citrate lyase synthetase
MCEINTYALIDTSDILNPKIIQLIGIARNLSTQKNKDHVTNQYNSRLRSILENCNDTI